MLDINLLKEHPGKIKNVDKKITEKLDYDGTEFPIKENDFDNTEIKNNVCINVLGFKNGLVFSNLCFGSNI